MRRPRGRGQQGRPDRKIERVAVPMQRLDTPQMRKTRMPSRFGDVEPAPTDLLLGPGIHTTPKRCSHQLRPKANSDRGRLPGKTTLQSLHLVKYPGILVSLVHSNRPPEDDHQVCTDPLGTRYPCHAGLTIVNRKSEFNENGLKDPKVLKTHMLKRKTFHSGSPRRWVGTKKRRFQRHFNCQVGHRESDRHMRCACAGGTDKAPRSDGRNHPIEIACPESKLRMLIGPGRGPLICASHLIDR